MWNLLKTLIKQPYPVILLVVGAFFVGLSCTTVESLEKGYRWSTHSPNPWLLAWIGLSLLIVSIIAFGALLIVSRQTDATVGQGLDLSKVTESNGALSAIVGRCRIEVVEGRIEEFAQKGASTVVVLPCNEYFDDQCVYDARSALGAFAQRAFDGNVSDFARVLLEECEKRFAPGTERQKTAAIRALSFGAGKCVLLMKPLQRSMCLAVVSTTTQRVGEGLSARISYLFEGIRQVVAELADLRINEVVMPVLGAGHGGISPPLALVGLLLALADQARSSYGQHMRHATVVVFRKSVESSPEVDQVVVRRALALVGDHG